MNDYIQLDGKCYKTTHKSWHPKPEKPATIRLNLDGSVDATYGNGTMKVWQGEIAVPVTPRTESLPGGLTWGTIDNLRASLDARRGMPFYDHYGLVAYTVHSENYEERSLSPDWNSAENMIYFNVKLKGA